MTLGSMATFGVAEASPLDRFSARSAAAFTAPFGGVFGVGVLGLRAMSDQGADLGVSWRHSSLFRVGDVVSD